LDFGGETVSVRMVTVMRSDLRPAGAVYSPIKVFPLLGKAEHN
jgi:2'-5' RNA ligase